MILYKKIEDETDAPPPENAPETKVSGAFLQRRISVVWTMRVRASRTVAFCPSS